MQLIYHVLADNAFLPVKYLIGYYLVKSTELLRAKIMIV